MPSATPHRCGTVALVGRTNVGKSTLLNRLVREKISIVSASPQTTRNRIVGVVTLPEAQVAFVDTPGIHRPRHRMNRAMVAAAFEAVRQVDLVVLLMDAADGIGPTDRSIAAELRARRGPGSCLLALNKVDLVRKDTLLPMIAEAHAAWGFEEIVPISARAGDNCEALLGAIVARLPHGPPLFPPDELTDQPQRRLVAEIVREKLLARMREELPHETAVAVERWQERPDGLVEIDAAIYCERESQKAILIGRGGERLKEVGTEARAEAERLLESRLMLRLWVKVRGGWRDDARVLRELGISED